MSHFKYLDRLKGIAIIGVLSIHSLVLWDDIVGWLKNTLGIGIWGPYLFFVVSGFCAMISYEKSNNYLTFIGRRWIKLAPLYCAMAFLYRFLFFLSQKNGWPIGFEPTLANKNLLLNCFLLHCFSESALNSVVPGGWYVGVLFLFYLLMPILWFFVKKIDKMCANSVHFEMMFVIIIFVLAENLLLYFSRIYVGNTCLSIIIHSLPSYMLGMFFFLSDKRIKEQAKRINAKESIVLFVLISLFVILIMNSQNASINLYALFMLFHSCLFFLVIAMDRMQGHFLEYLGKNSYYMYLIHAVPFWYGGHALRRLFISYNVNISFGLYFITATGMTIVLAELLKRCEIRIVAIVSIMKNKTQGVTK